MRQIDYDAQLAFWNNEKFNRGNTQVFYDEYDQKTRLLLHGHCIATKQDCILTLHSCGWQTVTTKARLNAILERTEYSIYQKDFVWYLYKMPVLNAPAEDINFFDGMEIEI